MACRCGLLHGGPSFWIDPESIGNSVELLADYGAQIWYAAGEQIRAVIGRFGQVQPRGHARLRFDFDEGTEEVYYVLA